MRTSRSSAISSRRRRPSAPPAPATASTRTSPTSFPGPRPRWSTSLLVQLLHLAGERHRRRVLGQERGEGRESLLADEQSQRPGPGAARKISLHALLQLRGRAGPPYPEPLGAAHAA